MNSEVRRLSNVASSGVWNLLWQASLTLNPWLRQWARSLSSFFLLDFNVWHWSPFRVWCPFLLNDFWLVLSLEQVDQKKKKSSFWIIFFLDIDFCFSCSVVFLSTVSDFFLFGQDLGLFGCVPPPFPPLSGQMHSHRLSHLLARNNTKPISTCPIRCYWWQLIIAISATWSYRKYTRLIFFKLYWSYTNPWTALCLILRCLYCGWVDCFATPVVLTNFSGHSYMGIIFPFQVIFCSFFCSTTQHRQVCFSVLSFRRFLSNRLWNCSKTLF